MIREFSTDLAGQIYHPVYIKDCDCHDISEEEEEIKVDAALDLNH